MGFIAQPNLDNEAFKQLSGTTLTLSGQTNISSISGLTLSDGNNTDVIVTASGASSATTGQVLTYDGSVIKLMQSSLSGDTPFVCGSEDIRRSPYCGLNMSATTVGTFLERFFFPDAPPTSNICFTTGSISREYGDTSFIGTCNLCWNIEVGSNSISTICASTGGTGSFDGTISVTGGSQSGVLYHTYATICACPTTPVASSSVDFKIYAETVSGETTTDTTSITWRDTKYWGGNSVNYIGSSSGTTNSAVNSLCCSKLSSTGCECFCNFCVGDNNFFYYAYPSIFGEPQQISVNGLPNNSWGCSSLGTLDTFCRCNSNGYCQEFYLVRSDNRISGSFNINIETVC
jgi:hypothetical protein